MADAHSPTYLDRPEDVERFMSALGPVSELAIDTEGASFHRFVDRIYLLQLSTRSAHAIIDPLPMAEPPRLGALLEDPTVEIVFHDADYDLRLLHQDYGWHVRNIFDTRIAAQLLGLTAFGLAALLERYFGVKLEKKFQRADWSLRPLSAGMLDYAAEDTRYLLELRDKLRAELEAKGRMAWAREEFARLEGTRWEDEDPSMGWMRLKGARDLNRRQLAILRELVSWRDDVARTLDRATFRVMGNETLLELAKLAPRSRNGLTDVKGMPRGLAAQRGEEIIDAVMRGIEVPEAALPRFPRAQRWDRDPDFDDRVSRIKAARDAAAERLQMDPGVLCSRDRMESIARNRPSTIDELAAVDGMRRWQAEEIGPAFLDALASSRDERRSA